MTYNQLLAAIDQARIWKDEIERAIRDGERHPKRDPYGVIATCEHLLNQEIDE